MSSIHLLLKQLIDYAGLFPPAELSMREAVANYERYLGGAHAWMLGRFVVPASRLAEWESSFREVATSSGQPWLLSALVESAAQADRFSSSLQAIAEFNARNAVSERPAALVDTIEGRAATEQEIVDANRAVPSEMHFFLELPLDSGLPALLDEIQRAQAHRPLMAKIRTGGVVATAIPAVRHVTTFLAECAARQIGFKATAGLHHPVRGEYRLTYCQPSPRAVMYGFLNVFVAACAAFDDPRNLERIDAILMETDPRKFLFQEESIGWRDEHWSSAQVSDMRRKAISFGSCSFEEPREDLQALSLIA